MTMDGGLERLVRILHEFCMCPPPPEDPAILYGLTPPSARQPKLSPALNPHSFDKPAAYRFSLAFQCVVNIGVCGSEPIRSRVGQAGTLDVVGWCGWRTRGLKLARARVRLVFRGGRGKRGSRGGWPSWNTAREKRLLHCRGHCKDNYTSSRCRTGL